MTLPRLLGRALLALAIMAAAAILLPVGTILYWQSLDPVSALPRPRWPAGGAVAVETVYAIPGGRQAWRQRLTDPDLGTTDIVVSLPDPLPPEPMPIVVVLGGIPEGDMTLAMVPDPGANVLVGLDWPVDPNTVPDDIRMIEALVRTRDRILAAPGSLVSALGWVVEQPWADGERVTLLGFSMGAIAAPSIHRIAAEQGLEIDATVLAYGGAGFADMIGSHPELRPAWARPLIGWALGAALNPIDPAHHLSAMIGDFLVLQGANDTLLARVATERFHDLVPDPKEVVTFEGDHMGIGPGQRRLLYQIIDTSRDWLWATDAVNLR